MNTIEVRLREHRLKDEIGAGFLQYCNTGKRHFISAYLFSCYLQNSLPPWHKAFRDDPPVNPEDETGKAEYDPGTIMRKLKVLDSAAHQQFLDLLTVLAPSRYHFFLSDVKAILFSTHLGNCNEGVRGSLSRCLFLSPAFLSFSALVFRPILSPVAGSSNPDISSLKTQIQERWKSAMGHFPPGVSSILKAKPLARQIPGLLSVGFFECALTPENARLYGLVEYWLDLSPPMCDALRSLLTVAGTASIVAELAAEIPDAPSGALIRKDDTSPLNSLFLPMLGSTVDDQVYTELQQKCKLPAAADYSVVRVWTGLTEPDGVDGIVQTLRPGTAAAALRHMLQRADPIPRFFAVPPGLTVIDFFREYIVEGGPRETRYQRQRDCDVALAQNHNMSAIIRSLQSTGLDRAEELVKLSMLTRIERIYREADVAGAEGRATVQRALAWVTRRGDIRNTLKPPEYYAPERYVPNPGACALDVKTLRNLLWKVEFPSAFDPEVQYASVTSRITFFAFKKLSPELAGHDDMVFTKLAESQAERVTGFCSRRDDADQKWLKKSLKKIVRENAVIVQLQSTTRDLHPLRMLQEFASARNMVRERLHLRAKPTVTVSDDDVADVLSAALVLANPVGLVSAFVFLHDFLLPARYGADILPGLYDAIMPVISGLLSPLPTIDLGALVKLQAAP